MHRFQFLTTFVFALAAVGGACSNSGGTAQNAPAQAEAGGTPSATLPGRPGAAAPAEQPATPPAAGAAASSAGSAALQPIDAGATSATTRAQDAGSVQLDAGARDAASPAADSGSSSGACPGTFCDSFESGSALDPQRWEVVTPSCSGTGKVTLDASQAHSGTHSVRVDGGGGYCNHVFFRPLMAAFTPGDPLYARFFVRLSTALGPNHVSLLAMRDDNDNGKDLRMGGQMQILMWNRESDDATLPELSPAGTAMSVQPATNKWSCVEFEVDGANGTLHTWVDGQAVAGLTVEGMPTPDVDAQWQRKSDWHPKLGDVRFGWESYGNDTNTLWFDDIALGTSRLGCTP